MGQQLDDGLAFEGGVLDHQQALEVRRCGAPQAVERGRNLGRGAGLDQAAEGATLAAEVALVFDADDLHRDVARCGVELELVHHRPAQQIGQEQIERDGGRPEAARHADGRRAVQRHQALEAARARQLEQHAGITAVVFDDEHHQIARLKSIPVVGHAQLRGQRQDRQRGARVVGAAAAAGAGVCAGGPGVEQRQVEREGAALTGLADQANLAPQQRGQLAADGQAQPGAAELAAGAGVGLLEGLEHQSLLVGRDADAGVGDGKSDDGPATAEHRVLGAPALARTLHAQAHLPRRRELEGVGQQVAQDLLQPRAVAADGRRQARLEFQREGQSLALGDVAEAALHRLGQVGEGQRFGLHGDGAGLDLRQVEDVGDEHQQVTAGGVDVARELDLFGRQVAGGIDRELLAQDQDAVQRRAQLVRHVGQELRLVLRGQGKFSRLVLQRPARLFDLGVLLGQQLGLVFELLVALPQGLGALRHALLQIGGELAQLAFGVFAYGDFIAQLQVDLGQAGQRERAGHHLDQRKHSPPRNDRRDRLDHAGEAIPGVPEDGGLDEVPEAAAQDEGGEEPEQRDERHVLALADEVHQRQRDGGVGREDRQIRPDVQPAMPRRPVATAPARRKAAGVEQELEE